MAKHGVALAALILMLACSVNSDRGAVCGRGTTCG